MKHPINHRQFFYIRYTTTALLGEERCQTYPPEAHETFDVLRTGNLQHKMMVIPRSLNRALWWIIVFHQLNLTPQKVWSLSSTKLWKTCKRNSPKFPCHQQISRKSLPSFQTVIVRRKLKNLWRSATLCLPLAEPTPHVHRGT